MTDTFCPTCGKEFPKHLALPGDYCSHQCTPQSPEGVLRRRVASLTQQLDVRSERMTGDELTKLIESLELLFHLDIIADAS